MNSGCSDHSPIAINFEDAPGRGHRPFRFLNCLSDHPNFIQLVREAWSIPDHNHSMYKIWARLKNVKQDMKQLNIKEFSGIENKIINLRGHLDEIQARMRDLGHTYDLFKEEKELKLQLEKWSLIEEGIARQKSMIQWLNTGDSNTKFFYASMKGRHVQNQIRRIVNVEGILLNSETDFEHEITDFFRKLLGTAATYLPAIDPRVLKLGHRLTRQQQLDLIAPVTKQEVYDALNEVDDNKALGVDGFNAVFFKKAWSVVGDDITQAILGFFESANMCKPLNCTSVTLIPK
ncbi:PREDICTED: uncharacterized protein LOC109212962 [Nicotiana attenuata]|uniref:uncharacterized protein LOC109212962 n=1 Tax=Nicotiana attenuata TaxID=49451 RepID=UPI000905655A|nr:PREDICTED: uncharacterized protein LOC109212962 [Nicotiana attenuata]